MEDTEAASAWPRRSRSSSCLTKSKQSCRKDEPIIFAFLHPGWWVSMCSGASRPFWKPLLSLVAGRVEPLG
jgi:hypothetical protein